MRLATVDATRQARDGVPVREQRREHRDERRRDGTGGHQLVDEVRDAERREVGVEVGVLAEDVADDHQPDPAQQPRGQECGS